MNNEFCKVVREFIPDFLNTFPEFTLKLHPGIKLIVNKEETDDKNTVLVDELYLHTKQVLPERFFDILYQNSDMFQDENINTEFIKGIEFKEVWNNDSISDNTKSVIWKYLQLLLFSVVSDIDNQEIFGDTAKLFEAISENEFQSKLEETLKDIQNYFDFSGNMNNNKERNPTNGSNNEGTDISNDFFSFNNFSKEDIPDPNSIHEYINSMMDGKIGSMAKEIAEETFKEMENDEDLKKDMEKLQNKDNVDTSEVFKILMKNPQKIMKLSNRIGNKIETKLKNGDISERELMQEASDMMSKMKEMPGMGNMNDIIKKFGGMMNGKNMGSGLNTFQNKMSKHQTRERLLEKLKKRQEEQEMKMNPLSNTLSENTNDVVNVVNSVYRDGEIIEKTPRKKVNGKKGNNKKKKKKK